MGRGRVSLGETGVGWEGWGGVGRGRVSLGETGVGGEGWGGAECP